MARNEEKAQATLNRYWTHRKQLDSGDLSLPERRPRFAHEVTDLKQADKWRKQIQRDIGERITRIQNASLPEQEIRTINDEINRLLKTRVHWEEQVRKLGGRD